MKALGAAMVVAGVVLLVWMTHQPPGYIAPTSGSRSALGDSFSQMTGIAQQAQGSNTK